MLTGSDDAKVNNDIVTEMRMEPRKLILTVSAILVVATVQTACVNESADTAEDISGSLEADITAVRLVHTLTASAINSGDIETFVSKFSDDAVILPANRPIIEGREALRSWFQGYLDNFIVELNFSPEDILVSSDLAVERFTYTWTVTPKTGGASITTGLLSWNRPCAEIG